MKTLDVPWCRQLNERMSANVEWRRYYNPHATDYEDEIGCFIEDMEPQVDGAVRMLRAKGYSTVGSGFAGEAERQYVQWMSPSAERVEIPGAAVGSLGVEYRVHRLVPPNLPHGDMDPWTHVVTLIAPGVLSFKEWTLAWNAFGEHVPDLNRKAPSCPTPVAIRFRENYVGWLGVRMERRVA